MHMNMNMKMSMDTKTDTDTDVDVYVDADMDLDLKKKINAFYYQILDCFDIGLVRYQKRLTVHDYIYHV